MCELAAVRNLLFEPRDSPYNDDGTTRLSDDDEVIATCDVAKEGAVNYLKVGVASVLLSACTTDGPLTVRDVNAAAEHLFFIHERFVKARMSDNYHGF